MNRQRGRGALAVVAGLAMFAVGCGSPEASGGGATIGDDGKLTERTELTIAIPGKQLPILAPIMAKAWKKFDERNLDVTIETLASDEAFPLLATGKLDGIWTGPSVGLFNAVAGGADVRMVSPGNYLSEESGGGIWVSSALLNGREFEPSMLRGKKFASSQGNTGTSMVAFSQLLESGGVGVDEVEIVTMSASDAVPALENGSISGAIVQEPLDVALEKNNSAVRVSPQFPDGWNNTTLLFGPSLLRDNPDAGKVFVAALRSTFVDKLQGDYLADPERVADIAEQLEQPVETLQQSTSDRYPTELSFPDEYVATHEEVWRQWPDLLTYDEPLTTEQVIDTQFMDWANEH